MCFKFYAKHSDRKESPDSGGKPGTVAPGRAGLQESYRLPKRRRTRKAICTYNARTLASEAAIEDLMMQVKKIKYDVIGLKETRRRHPLNAVYKIGEELTEEVLVELAPSSTRVWQRTSTLPNNLRPESDVCG
ncbi:hypothetical protein RB195_023048 [Necator americanus]|uniref:Endonuclease/exonuclease/phosphatase domain-containing protein n=1 Tax=Necator americanus TaxID=51031 RepID=A0ABR1EHL7_NECAM